MIDHLFCGRKVPWVAIVALVSVLGSCGEAPSEEDRLALIGLWMPENGSGKYIEFKADGVFDYKYFVTLRVHWQLLHPGEVQFGGIGGGGERSCYYEIKDGVLHIDNGKGETCLTPNATPPDPMPLTFRRQQ